VFPPRDRTIDRIYLTHPQQGHVAGFPELLARYDVAQEFDAGRSSHRLYVTRSGDCAQVQAGDSFEQDGVLLEVLWPPPGYNDANANDTALIIRITYGTTRVLLTSDSEAADQLALMKESDVRADILKVPHHGSKTTSPEFLAAVAPSVALYLSRCGQHLRSPEPGSAGCTGGRHHPQDRPPGTCHRPQRRRPYHGNDRALGVLLSFPKPRCSSAPLR
jgi:competence protein ComEC